jgi:site-specific DNA-adenine methylase
MDKIPCQEKGINDETHRIQFLEIFNKFQEEIYKENFEIKYPDFDVASKYMYIITQIWSGYNPEGANYIYLKGNYKAKYKTFKEKLKNPKWLKYFNRITDVEKLDFSQLMDKYDSENSFFYLDPPYYSREKYYNNHDFNLDDHIRLSEYLKGIKGKFALSYYPFDGLEDMYPKDKYIWVSKDFVKAGGARKGQKQNYATELLIMNYNL